MQMGASQVRVSKRSSSSAVQQECHMRTCSMITCSSHGMHAWCPVLVTVGVQQPPLEFNKSLSVLPLHGDVMAFHESVQADNNCLHVLIVDECHLSATSRQAHDAAVNAFRWIDDNGRPRMGPTQQLASLQPAATAGDILACDDLVTLLVSATPYAVLSAGSRIPNETLQLNRPGNQVQVGLGLGLRPGASRQLHPVSQQ